MLWTDNAETRDLAARFLSRDQLRRLVLDPSTSSTLFFNFRYSNETGCGGSRTAKPRASCPVRSKRSISAHARIRVPWTRSSALSGLLVSVRECT